jgi:hypothetical protein
VIHDHHGSLGLQDVLKIDIRERARIERHTLMVAALGQVIQ